MVTFYKCEDGILITASGEEVLDSTFSTDWSKVTTDNNGDFYAFYVLDEDGMYQPDLERIEADNIESLKVLKRAERDKLLILANYAVIDAEDRGEDPTSAKAWRVALKDFPNREGHPEWYLEDLPTKE
jgi:hypothetical protein